ncbi:MAG: WhiB family transcriptional regulator [Oryzihumus sp.]
MNWRDEAECLHTDPELFFPVGTSGPALIQIQEAKSVCRRCPALDECLEWALDSGQETGIWGATDERERNLIRRRRSRAAQRPAS